MSGTALFPSGLRPSGNSAIPATSESIISTRVSQCMVYLFTINRKSRIDLIANSKPQRMMGLGGAQGRRYCLNATMRTLAADAVSVLFYGAR